MHFVIFVCNYLNTIPLPKILVLVLFCLSLPQSIAAQGNPTILAGRIIDEKERPIEFALVQIQNLGLWEYTDAEGKFTLTLPQQEIRYITLQVSYVNKAPLSQKIDEKDFSQLLLLILQDQSLTLDAVQLSAVREKKHSASSIVFNREAIVQSQAFSLADILMNLPGKVTQAPDLQTPMTPSLRTAAQGVNAMNNSFGIAIYIDGVRLNKDTDIQSRSLSINGLTDGGISSHKDEGKSYDVTYDGVDLRNISLENVERIEVIQGVADARYGELTNGAILITTKAGRTPINVNLNLNGGSTQITGSKGFQLKNKAGAINLSAGYTHSNKDPRDKVKSYDRINASAKWTVDILKELKNTFSLSLSKKLDDVKMDPDDDTEQRTFQKDHDIRISNRTAYRFKKGIIRDLELNISYSEGHQESYSQWLLNGMPFGIADRDTTGVYEGFYVPGAYLATEHILGKPISIQGDFSIQSKIFYTGPLQHALRTGYTLSSSGNKGPGMMNDPRKPRWQAGLEYRSERPVDRSKLLPYLTNHGIYVQDHITGNLGSHRYSVNVGMRADIQNHFVTYQPRLGLSYSLSNNWGVSFSYGTSTKAPSLALRYPVPSWIDIPVLQLYNGYANESLFLVYTKKTEPDNAYLKAAKTSNMELGINFKNTWSNGSLFMYKKKSTDGFNSVATPTPIYVPKYDYNIRQDKKIQYWPTGDDDLYTESRKIASNGLYTEDYGMELMFSTKKIEALSSSFSISAGYTRSIYDNRYDTLYKSVTKDLQLSEHQALYAVYASEKKKSSSLVTTFSSTTHIPSIGFTATFSADLELIRQTRRKPGDRNAIAYLDRSFTYINIPEADRGNTMYSYLRKPEETQNLVQEHHVVFPAINVTLAKEIKEKIRIMLKAYNMFNIRPEYVNPVTKEVEIYNAPISISAGINFQL